MNGELGIFWSMGCSLHTWKGRARNLPWSQALSATCSDRLCGLCGRCRPEGPRVSSCAAPEPLHPEAAEWGAARCGQLAGGRAGGGGWAVLLGDVRPPGLVWRHAGRVRPSFHARLAQRAPQRAAAEPRRTVSHGAGRHRAPCGACRGEKPRDALCRMGEGSAQDRGPCFRLSFPWSPVPRGACAGAVDKLSGPMTPASPVPRSVWFPIQSVQVGSCAPVPRNWTLADPTGAALMAQGTNATPKGLLERPTWSQAATSGSTF